MGLYDELLALQDPCPLLTSHQLRDLITCASVIIATHGDPIWEDCRNLIPKDIFKIYTYASLAASDLSEGIFQEALISHALNIALEQICLCISLDSKIAPALRENLEPQPAASGLMQSFILFSLPAQAVIQAAAIEQIPPALAKQSSIYKPRNRAAGAIDGPRLYTDNTSPFYYILGERKMGPELFPVDPNWEHEVPLLFPSVDVKNSPKHLNQHGVRFTKLSRARMAIDPGDETLRERLFYLLSLYLESKLGIAFDVPFTTVEKLSYPEFGSHHKVGSRQQFIADARTLQGLYIDMRLGKPCSLPDIPAEEFAKTALIHLIAASLDCTLDNVLVKESKLISIDAGHSFPHFRGTKTDSAQHAWAFFPQSFRPFPKQWHEGIANINSEEIITIFQNEVENLNKRFSEEKFLFSPSCELVLHAGVMLVQEGVRQGLTPAQLARFQDLYTRKDANGKPLTRSDGKDMRDGGEFWLCIALAMIEAGAELPIERAALKDVYPALRKYLKLTCEKEPILRSNSTAWEELKKANDPLVLLLKVLDGELSFW